MQRFFIQFSTSILLMLMIFQGVPFSPPLARAEESQCDSLPSGGPRESCEEANRLATPQEMGEEIKKQNEAIQKN
ncbi:MAG: hypothetical protein AAB634_02445, partial [Patescibacteria group bacterium]